MQVHTAFDCGHERDVEIPERVRGLGKCPACTGEEDAVAIGGIAPQPGGKVVLDSILMMTVQG